MNLELLNLLTTIVLSLITVCLIPLVRYIIQIEKRLTVIETTNKVKSEMKSK